MPTIYYNADLDTYIRESTPTTANGSADQVIIGKTGAGLATNRARGLFRFSGLAALPANAENITVSLFLNSNGSEDGDGRPAVTYNAYRMLRAFTESATWNTYDGSNAWGTAGAANSTSDYSTSNADSYESSGGSYLEFEELAALFTDAVTNQSGVLRLLVLGNELANEGTFWAHSREAGDLYQKPQIEVNYTLSDNGSSASVIGSVLDGDSTRSQSIASGAFADTNLYGLSKAIGDISGEEARALVKFDLSELPANATILTAGLRVHVEGGDSSTTGTFTAKRLTRDFVYDQVTWNDAATGTAWTTPGGDVDGSTASYAGQIVCDNSTYNFQRLNLLLEGEAALVTMAQAALADDGILRLVFSTDYAVEGITFETDNQATTPELYVTYSTPDEEGSADISADVGSARGRAQSAGSPFAGGVPFAFGLITK